MTHIRKSIQVSASVLALALTAPVFAAEAAGDETATGAYSGDIVVMARKRAETSQSVPVSLNVASEKDLVNRGVVSLTDIQQQAPAIRFSQAAINATGVFLAGRGLVVTDTRMTVDPVIGYYVDGVYIPRLIGIGATDMFDVGRVEILKGPQGTLFGKNNTAGAIAVYSNEPSDKLEGKVRLRAAEHGEVSGAAAINLPISDMAALRVTGQATHRAGYGTNLFNGDKLGRLSAQSVRATLKLTPKDGIKVLLRGDYLNADGTGTAYKGGTTLTGSALCEVVRAMTGGCSIGAAGAVYTNAAVDQPAAIASYLSFAQGNPNDGNVNITPTSKTEAWGYSGTIDAELSDSISAKSITAWHYIRDVSTTDLDGSPYQIIGYNPHILHSSQFSQELQLNAGLMEDRLNLMFGGYYASETGYEKVSQITLGLVTAANGPTINEANILNRTIAGFAQASFKINDQLSLTGGARYTQDKRRLESFNRNNTTCLAKGLRFTNAAYVGPCTTGVLNATFSAWSWSASLDYKPMDGVMLFARADRGYRTGAIPLTGGVTEAGAPTTAQQNMDRAALSYVAVKPEYAMSFEVGFKTDLLDRKVRFNASYFNVTYSDLQRSSSSTIPNSNPPIIVSTTANIAKARVQGFEADVMFRPVEGLELGGNLAYLSPKYITYGVPGVNASNVAVTIDYRGQPFVYVPNWTYSLTGAYTLPVGSAEVRFQADYGWQSTSYTSPVQTLNANKDAVTQYIAGVVKPHGNLNGRVSVKFDNGLSLAVFGRNLTNDQTPSFPLSLSTTLGIYSNGNSAPPRTFGGELSFEF